MQSNAQSVALHAIMPTEAYLLQELLGTMATLCVLNPPSNTPLLYVLSACTYPYGHTCASIHVCMV